MTPRTPSVLLLFALSGLYGCSVEADELDVDATSDAARADGTTAPDADGDAASFPPGCEAELNEWPSQGTAACVYAVESDQTLPDQRRPFTGHAAVTSVTEESIVTPVLPGTTPAFWKYVLTFDFGFSATCTLIGVEAPWVEGDSLWLEAQSGGWSLDFEYAAHRRSVPPRCCGRAVRRDDRGSGTLHWRRDDTTADLALLGLTLSRRPVCPFVPWPDLYDAERVGREMELTFANTAGETLALRRGEAGEIALPDGRRARITLGTAREFQPAEDPDHPPMRYSFVLTLTP
jgi:hypothetical protein